MSSGIPIGADLWSAIHLLFNCPVELWYYEQGGRMNHIQEFATKITENVERVIIGKKDTIELLMVALLCEGHILIEDVPGVGKTILARAVAISLGGQFKRLQCTPDLLPNDVTGVSIYNQQSGQFEFRQGPVFVNILLADEINRATPRTQSSLLEAMQEQQVTVDGITHALPRPFMVMATQNPIEYEGTFPLPEAQLDRFLMRLSIGYPVTSDEKALLIHLQREHPINSIRAVVEGNHLIDFQKQVWEVFVDETLQDYIIQLVSATRNHPDLALGASPRASLALYKTAQALAALRGRDHVIPDDIKYLVPVTLTHRLIVTPEAELRGRSPATIVNELLASTALDLGSIK
jgi:MoxR-like ATPase